MLSERKFRESLRAHFTDEEVERKVRHRRMMIELSRIATPTWEELEAARNEHHPYVALENQDGIQQSATVATA